MVWMLALALGSPLARGADSAEGIEYFEKHIRPLLAEHCYSCHSSRSEKGVQGGLNLESRAGWMHGGDSGPVVVPGAAGRSLLLKAVRHEDPRLEMPAKAKKLPPEDIAHLEAWIQMGAPDPRTGQEASTAAKSSAEPHWAFQPIRSPSPPTVRNQAQTRNPIDAFLLEKLEAKGLKLSPAADRHTLIRRLHFVLTGLPPSDAEARAFAEDKSADAYSRVVERLLASPQYGERWARYWLDIARYADTKGYVFEEERRYPYSYTYRDYVIRAFNEDIPYDRFLIEQLAADLLPLGEDRRSLAAMGYLTLGRRFLNNQADIIDDRIDVVTRGMMGLTVVCARCHDHKYDPIPTKDYYSLYGVFASSHEPGEKPLLGDAALPKQHPDYLAERKKRVDERTQYREEQDEEALLKVRSQLGDYLMATHDVREQAEGESREKLIRERKLEPVVARKFREPYGRWLTNAPAVIVPWIRLASLTPSNFVADYPGVLAALDAGVAAEWKVHATNSPSSLKDVVEIYNSWFKSAALGMRKPGSAQAEAPSVLARTFLEGSESPFRLKADELHRLFPTPVQQKLRAQQRRIDELDATHPGAPPRAMVMAENAQPDAPRVFRRGNPGLPGDPVPRQFLEVLSSKDRKPFQKGSGRLEMAQAIASEHNPLTARVFVNRVWQYHFGGALVKTPSDFGVRSDPPTHPELLDYLASRFIAGGWSIKNLHRLILDSAAFQQSSADREVGDQVDPSNQLLWRQNRRRLDFESMRDTLLAVSGRLDLTPGGHPVEITTQPFTTRRTIYGFVERQNLPGLFRTFDFASPDTTSPQRFSTTVPQQALFLMNSPFIVEQARAVMNRPELTGALDDDQKIRRLYAILYQRPPDREDLALGRDFLKSKLEHHDESPSVPAWRYGYGGVDEEKARVTGFTDLSYFSQYAWQGGKELPDSKVGWVLLSAVGGHPGKNPGFAAIRRWTAPRDGKVVVRGELSHPSEQGDGVRGRVISSRSGLAGKWSARHSKTETVVQNLQVAKGDTLDFVTDCGGDEGYDSFEWAPRIRYLDANGKAARSDGTKVRWVAKDDFSGPIPPAAPGIGPWELYAQALLLSNELFFVD